ncbi:MAG: AMP-binding protein [Candidatus Lokiarchaeia archaeon]|nr:AMP-binding protein [Candidatus Lokiarchaeia archaeon]
MNVEMSKDDLLKFYGIDKKWPKETPRHIDYEAVPLGQLLSTTALKYPDSEAIFFEGFRMTYLELDTLVDQFATALAKLGIKKGDVICIDLPNIPQYVIAHWAVVRIGATSNPILPVNRFVEIVHQVNDSKAETLIILDFLYEEYLLNKDLSKMPTLKQIILTGTAEYLPPLKAKLGTALGKVPRMKEWPKKEGDIIFHKFQEILNNGVPIDIPKVDFNLKEDISVLIYTGGTTGVPKGVMTSHYSMVVNALQTDVWATTQLPEMNELKGKGGMMLVVPLAHSFGNIGMTVSVLEGWKMILLPRPPERISDILKIMMKEKATYMPGVPTLYIKINEDPNSSKYKGKLDSLIACISAASAIPEEVKNEYERLTGVSIVEGYGMSECSPVVCLNPFQGAFQKVNTVGFPLSDTLLKIVDAENGTQILFPCPNESCENCGENEFQYIGEICCTGPQVMNGYLGRKVDSDYALRKDSEGVIWYYTADIGCVDKEGYLHIKDRKRDMIKRKGHGVFPREVEDLIYMHEAVSEVGVIGVPDTETGQEIKAFISLKPEFKGKITVEELLEWCKTNISPYKYPRMIEIVPELPKSVVGKILRRELRKE